MPGSPSETGPDLKSRRDKDGESGRRPLHASMQEQGCHRMRDKVCREAKEAQK